MTYLKDNWTCRHAWIHRIPLRDLTIENVSSGVISSLLVMTGPAILILQVGLMGHFSEQQTVSWMFAVYFLGGIFSIVNAMWYKIPITGAHSLSGVAFLVTVAGHYTYPELIGGFVVSGALIVVIGMSGVFTKILALLPMEVVSAMLSGMITVYVVRLVTSVYSDPLVGSAAIGTYFLFTKFVKRVPAVIGAVAAAFIVLFTTSSVHVPASNLSFHFPALQMPQFTLASISVVGIPLSLLILSNDIATGISALHTYGYTPPTNKLVWGSGVASMLVSVFGGQCTNVAGMMTAICADDASGPKEKRYLASVVSGVLLVLFGIFAFAVVPFIKALPSVFVVVLVGLSLISVLASSIRFAFSNSVLRLSTLSAFVIALSNVSFFHISSPVWSLVVGLFVARWIERPKQQVRPLAE